MGDPLHAPDGDEIPSPEWPPDLSESEHAAVDALLRERAAQSAAECERDMPRLIARIDRIITEAGFEPPDRSDLDSR